MGGGGMQVETSGDAMTTMPLEHDEQPAVLRSVTAPVPASSVGSRAEASTPATSYTVARERLTEAVLNGGTADLQSAIDGALRAGMTGQEVRRARDAMAAIESADTRKRVELGVDEAIESDDWWKLQASMQAVVGAGFGDSDMVVNLREAMRTHRRRREVLREISRAAGARDAHALRTAVEAALLTHAQEADVRKAREALRALQRRSSAMDSLRRALDSDVAEVKPLQDALAEAESAGLAERPPELLGDDPEERSLVEDVKGELRTRARDRLKRLHSKRDAAGLLRTLDEAPRLGVSEAEIADFRQLLDRLHLEGKLRRELERSVQDGTKARMAAAVCSVEEAGLEASGEAEFLELVRNAREALRVCDEKEQKVSAVAAAIQELRTATAGDDMNGLTKALNKAEAVGVGVTADVSIARERLRLLRTRTCATQELQEAVQAANVYRLRAAITGARAHGVPERDMLAARDALAALEAKARSQRGLGSTTMAQDGELLRTAVVEAHPVGGRLGQREGARSAEAKMRELAQAKTLKDLRDVMVQQSPDLERLRSATRAAADAAAAVSTLGAAAGGDAATAVAATGRAVDAAWERLRVLERAAWLRSQLHTAVASGDVVRIRSAIKQAEMAGEDAKKDSPVASDLAAAKAELLAATARQHARQELRLARVGGNKVLLLAAVRAAEKAGLPRYEYEADAAACAGVVAPPETDAPWESEEGLPTLLGPPQPRECPSAGAAASKPSAGGRRLPSPPPPARCALSSKRRVRFAEDGASGGGTPWGSAD
mmetsp:Transcript_72805/g.236503  ORF Transcript_72805/g.236503 Transcript_72805/m.236503 type:complete len:779 (-) Transcript_72805:88-2424(-)